tara:strand:- start:82 stop:345 length:264 start_codon:yes stop_codon:yes gene_type:complete
MVFTATGGCSEDEPVCCCYTNVIPGFYKYFDCLDNFRSQNNRNSLAILSSNINKDIPKIKRANMIGRPLDWKERKKENERNNELMNE